MNASIGIGNAVGLVWFVVEGEGWVAAGEGELLQTLNFFLSFLEGGTCLTTRSFRFALFLYIVISPFLLLDHYSVLNVHRCPHTTAIFLRKY